MKLNDEYMIQSEELNVTLYKKTFKADKTEHWKPISYHVSLEKTYDSIIDREINLTGMENLGVVVEMIKELKSYVKESLKEINKQPIQLDTDDEDYIDNSCSEENLKDEDEEEN